VDPGREFRPDESVPDRRPDVPILDRDTDDRSASPPANATLVLQGPAAANVSTVEYHALWDGSAPENLVVHPRRVTVEPLGAPAYRLGGAALLHEEPTTGRRHVDPSAPARFAEPALGGTVGLLLSLEFDPGADEVGIAISLEAQVARSGGLPGRVVDEFALRTDARIDTRAV
jgi:hypothetical protein